MLHIDRFYGNLGYASLSAKKALKDMVITYADRLKIPIAIASDYPLKSLGGPSPWEYVDANAANSALKENGIYTII